MPSRARGWGNVARRGAREVARRRDFEAGAGTEADTRTGPRPAPGQRYSEPVRRSQRERPSKQAEWIRVDAGPSDAAGPRRGTGAKAGRGRLGAPGTTAGAGASAALERLAARKTLPAEVATAIRNAADTATARHKELLVEKTESAYGAYERGRYQDALRAIKPVADEAPAVAAVRELAGFAAYRSGRWREAARHLQALGALSDSTDYLPVLMDCQRALHKPRKVAELWSELRQSSPEPDVLAEGRIVAAASLADEGDLNGAIAMLSTAGAQKALRNPSSRHVRQWYLLADLYERAGDVPRAREFFERVRRADPEAYDVAERLRGLGPERRPRPMPRPRASSKPQPKTDKPVTKASRPAKRTPDAATTRPR